MSEDVIVEKIASMGNLADHFTKTLSTNVFDGYRDNIGVRFTPNMIKATGSLLK